MPGGMARDGWYPAGLGRGKLLRAGVIGEATVKNFQVMPAQDGHPGTQNDFTLEIRVPGGAPYELQGLFRIPVELISSVGTGAVVPVRVHPSKPTRAAIDWAHRTQ